MKRLKVNEEYFKLIDTIEKAYWLGFLYSDGSIIYRNGIPHKTVLALKDKDPIRFFKKHTEAEHKLSEFDIYDKRTLKIYKRFSLQITNPTFTGHVHNTGLIGKSNYKTQFPLIEQKYVSHFLRGLFDGEGHIVFTGGTGLHNINFLATHPIICYIKNFLKNFLNIEVGKIYTKATNSTGILSYIKICKWNDLVKLINFLYTDSDIETRLERKYLAANSLLNYREIIENSKPIFKFTNGIQNFEGKDLKNFCLENNLSMGRLKEVHKGQRSHYKGWKSRSN